LLNLSWSIVAKSYVRFGGLIDEVILKPTKSASRL